MLLRMTLPICIASCKSGTFLDRYKIFTPSMRVPYDPAGCIKIHPRKWGGGLAWPYKSTVPLQGAFNMHQSLIHIRIHHFNRGLVNYSRNPLSLRAPPVELNQIGRSHKTGVCVGEVRDGPEAFGSQGETRIFSEGLINASQDKAEARVKTSIIYGKERKIETTMVTCRLVIEQRKKCRLQPSIVWPTATGCTHGAEATRLLRSWNNCLPGVCSLSIREQRTERSGTISSHCKLVIIWSGPLLCLYTKKKKKRRKENKLS